MIISHKYKFIFLHVPKTAGSSIAAYMSQFLGDNDIMNEWNHSSKFGIWYNKKSLELLNNKYALKMISSAIKKRIKDGRIMERPILDYAIRKVLKLKLGSESRHIKAESIKKYDSKIWNSYFKFCFVRNPYSHAVSNWLWNENKWSLYKKKNSFESNGRTKQNFTKYLIKLKKEKNLKDGFKVPGTKIYTINNKICVDFVGKYENLQKDLDIIKKKLKLPAEKFNLPHEKKNSYGHYLKYFNEKNKKLVEQIWNKEFEFFDYKFQ